MEDNGYISTTPTTPTTPKNVKNAKNIYMFYMCVLYREMITISVLLIDFTDLTLFPVSTLWDISKHNKGIQRQMRQELQHNYMDCIGGDEE